jgi:Ca2+-binding RTX toxin-like protein/Mg-chelatase subunit ChlD
VTLTASAASVTEGGSIVYTATVNNAVTGTPLIVTLSNGQTITIPVGQSTGSVNSLIPDDLLFQGDRTLSVTVSGTSGGNYESIATTGTVNITIIDNDMPTLSVNSVEVTEGTDGFAVFSVNLSNPSTTAVSVNLALVNGTATGGGTDFGAAGANNLQVSNDGGITWANGTAATITAGSTSVLVRTPITNDTLDEASETFTLIATRTAGTTTNTTATGTGTINDDDATPALSIDNVTVNEADGTATFTVSLSTFSGQTVLVNYATSNGTATADADYSSRSGTLTFNPGTITQTITVPIINDILFETTETFNVTLSSPVNATIADNSGVGTILDNDTPIVRDDAITVNESALSNGTGGGVSSVSGNLLANDTGVTSITNVGGVTDGSAGDLDSRTGYIGVQHVVGGVNAGILTVDIAGGGLGDYTYDLSNNVDNSALANNASITSNIAYTTNIGSANVKVTIADDSPLVSNTTQNLSANEKPSYNLVLTLDVSGSMTSASNGGQVRLVNADGTVTVTTRLAMAKAALVQLVNEYFDQGTNVAVKLVTFQSTASILNGNVAYTDRTTLINAINAITGSGGTDYTDALNATKTALTGFIDPARENLVYFVSDGVPTEQDINNPAATSGYATFVNSNNVDSYAIGIGSGISNTGPLNGIANVDTDGDGVVNPAILVPDLNQLGNVLVGTVPNDNSGNIVSGVIANPFGADDGYLKSIVVQLDTNNNGVPDTNVTFTYNPATGQISASGGGLAGFPITSSTLVLDAGKGFTFGILSIDFTTGNYTFNSSSVHIGDSFNITYVVADNDGDLSAPSTTVFNINDPVPVARDDVDTLFANEEFYTGNVISGVGTDTIGNVSSGVNQRGTGADTTTDGAKVSSIVFQGHVFDLTTSSSGTAVGGTYNVNATTGTLSWTSSSDGSSLIFESDGYYKYEPSASDIPNTPSGALISDNLIKTGSAVNYTTSYASNGITYTGMSRSSTSETAGVRRTSDGIGVRGGDDNSEIDNLETLVITFDRATNPYGVEGVTITPDSSLSNLGGSIALTYSVYSIDGHLLGQVFSSSEGSVPMPIQYSNIGRIEVTANSDAVASISQVQYKSVTLNSGAAIAPLEIQYTLTDALSNTSSATLTLKAITNTIVGDNTNNTINGTTANDYIYGGAGNDTLSGLGGNDLLVGGAGNDTLIGGAGNNTLTGGSGADKFVLQKGEGGTTNTITDFSTTELDTIVINGANISGVSVSFATSSTSGSSYIITVNYSDATPTDIFNVILSNSAILQDAGHNQLNGVILSGTTATIDGTIVGATLYLDMNANGQEDAGERLGITDQHGHIEWVLDLAKLDVNGDGHYTIGEARAVQTGGFDIDTGLSYEINLFGPAGSSVISPLTSLLQAQLEHGLDYSTANTNIVAHLGLPAGTDIISLNPIMGTEDMLVQNAAVMTVAVQFAELAALHFSADEAHVSFTVFEAISKALLALPEGMVADFSDKDFLKDIATNLNLGNLASDDVIEFMSASQKALQTSLETLAPGDNALAAISEVQHLTQGSYAQTLEYVKSGYLPSQILLDLSVIILAYTSSIITYDELKSFNDQFTDVLNHGANNLVAIQGDGGNSLVNYDNEIVHELNTVVNNFITEHNIPVSDVQLTQPDVTPSSDSILQDDAVIAHEANLSDVYSNLEANSDGLILHGGGGNDFIYGSDANDMIFGQDGDDHLFGGKGDDTIDGGLGNDVIQGGMGNDELTGGGGQDIFVFDKADLGSMPAIDTITDFKLNLDGDSSADKSILDLTDLFKDSTLNSDSLDSLLQISTVHNETTNQTDTVIKTDPTGSAQFNASPETIVLSGVDVVSAYGTADSAELINHMMAANVIVMGH